MDQPSSKRCFSANRDCTGAGGSQVGQRIAAAVGYRDQLRYRWRARKWTQTRPYRAKTSRRDRDPLRPVPAEAGVPAGLPPAARARVVRRRPDRRPGRLWPQHSGRDRAQARRPARRGAEIDELNRLLRQPGGFEGVSLGGNPARGTSRARTGADPRSRWPGSAAVDHPFDRLDAEGRVARRPVLRQPRRAALNVKAVVLRPIGDVALQDVVPLWLTRNASPPLPLTSFRRTMLSTPPKEGPSAKSTPRLMPLPRGSTTTLRATRLSLPVDRDALLSSGEVVAGDHVSVARADDDAAARTKRLPRTSLRCRLNQDRRRPIAERQVSLDQVVGRNRRRGCRARGCP